MFYNISVEVKFMKKLLFFLFSVFLIIFITFLVGYKLGYFNEKEDIDKLVEALNNL